MSLSLLCKDISSLLASVQSRREVQRRDKGHSCVKFCIFGYVYS